MVGAGGKRDKRLFVGLFTIDFALWHGNLFDHSAAVYTGTGFSGGVPAYIWSN